ncbi:MAG: RNA methyltransferase [Porphyromonas sp.]|nr:RNA methyltransferase [Porphyromonas sp.]
MKPITNNEVKLISSLHHARYRRQHGLFIAETWKVIKELLPHFNLRLIACHSSSPIPKSLSLPQEAMREIDDIRLAKCSSLQTPREAIAVFSIPITEELCPNRLPKGIIPVLDRIQDPGNMGTIIRLCEWYGCSTLILGEGCVDPFSPKVVQSSMGALAGVTLYRDVVLSDWFSKNKSTFVSEIVATDMTGKNLYAWKPEKEQIFLLLGNEGSGISSDLKQLADCTITIPRSERSFSAESLNVGVASAIILSHLTASSFS